MKGFMLELSHPNQVTTWKTISGTEAPRRPVIILVTKNGNQQMMKIPITVPKVLAAFFSLANLAIFRLKLKFWPTIVLVLVCPCPNVQDVEAVAFRLPPPPPRWIRRVTPSPYPPWALPFDANAWPPYKEKN